MPEPSDVTISEDDLYRLDRAGWDARARAYPALAATLRSTRASLVSAEEECERLRGLLDFHGLGDPNGAQMILKERRRQVGVEGWTPEHDAEHTRGELISAAMSYAYFGAVADQYDDMDPVEIKRPPGMPDANGNYEDEITWPWDASWWKPSRDPVRNFVKAGALIAAEIDRLLNGRVADALDVPRVEGEGGE